MALLPTRAIKGILHGVVKQNLLGNPIMRGTDTEGVRPMNSDEVRGLEFALRMVMQEEGFVLDGLMPEDAEAPAKKSSKSKDKSSKKDKSGKKSKSRE